MFDVLKSDGPPYRFRIVAVPLSTLRQVFDWLQRHGDPGIWRTATFLDIGGLYDVQVSTQDADAAASFLDRWVQPYSGDQAS